MTERNLINLTGHDVTMLDENNNPILIIPSSGIIRLEESIVPAGSISAVAGELNDSSATVNVPLTKKSYGGTNLPEKQEGVMYVVSLAVAQYAKENGRYDFLVPSEIQRSEDRRTIL